MLSAFKACFVQDLQAIFRSPKEWLDPILFFSVMVALFGIGLGFDSQQLVQISPAIIWISFFVSALMTIDHLCRRDHSEGMFEQLLLSPQPLWWLLLAKSAAFWVSTSLPLLVIMPIVAIALHLEPAAIGILVLSVLLGSPAIIFLSVLGAALTVTLPRGGILLNLILLPLYIPLLILGESTLIHFSPGHWPHFELALLAAFSLLTIALIPHATAAALKVAMNE